ncbi:MAG: TetR/AcrR family transcriptional regulator [Nocardioides sp.]|nr:TetR/AcrR family transcriptional regulator [Nocardioides sp.]
MSENTITRPAQELGSREIILEAALRLAGERGYVGTTMALVKRATGLPASSLYWHFPNKDELLAEALEHGHDAWHLKPRWEKAPTQADLRDGLLQNLRRTTSDTVGDAPGFWRMGLLVAIESGPTVGDAPRERFRKIRGEVLQQFWHWWSMAVSLPPRKVDLLARLTLAALDGLFIHVQASGYAGIDPLLQRLATGLAAVAERLRAPLPSVSSPTTTHSSQRSENSSRERLVHAVMEVAAASGYEGASISRICAAAGVPASSLYWHFSGKEDLFASAVSESYREWGRTQTDWRTPPGAGSDWPRELTRKLTVTVAGVRGMPAFLRLGFLLLLPDRREPLPGRDTFLEVRRWARRDFSEWLRGALGRTADDTEPDEMGTLLLALCDGLAFADTLERPGLAPTVVADVLTCLITAPVEAPAPTGAAR